MSKEIFIAEHEKLIEEYMDEHPEASWDFAYNVTADKAGDRVREFYAEKADYERMKRKEQGL